MANAPTKKKKKKGPTVYMYISLPLPRSAKPQPRVASVIAQVSSDIKEGESKLTGLKEDSRGLSSESLPSRKLLSLFAVVCVL